MAASADVEALLLSGVPADVGVFRTAAGDLVLTLGGSEIFVKHFFAAPGGGFDWVVFDHDAAWSREELLLRAVDAPAAAADFAGTPLWGAADHSLPALPSDWHIEAYPAAPF